MFIAPIRRSHFIQGKSIKTICRELRASRKTMRKVILSGATGSVELGLSLPCFGGRFVGLRAKRR